MHQVSTKLDVQRSHADEANMHDAAYRHFHQYVSRRNIHHK